MDTSLEALTLELRLSEERFRTFMNNAPFVIFIKDAESRYLFYNARMAERFGVTPEEWLGKTDHEIWPQSVADSIRLNDEEVLASGASIERLEETIQPGGELTTWKIHKFCWIDERGERRLGGIGLDLSEELARERALTKANAQLQKLATIDGLTGLANRRVLDEQVEYEVRVSRRNNSQLSVVLLDIDSFKRRNDVFGHAAGDEVLHVLGGLIDQTLRITDTAARYGGEEFVVLLPGASTEGAHIFAERLRERMRSATWENEAVTASFGIASLTEEIAHGRQLIARADRAMYGAKRGGKDRVIDYGQILALETDETQP